VAYLGLGRAGRAATADRLLATAEDVTRPAQVRRAAILGLALGQAAGVGPRLVPLLDALDGGVAGAAAAALALLHERETLPALWRRAPRGAGAASPRALAARQGYPGRAGAPGR